MKTVFFAQKISFPQKEITMKVGETIEIPVEIYPEAASNNVISWEIHGDDAVHLLDGRNLTAVSVGTAILVARCDYAMEMLKVTVQQGKLKILVPRYCDLILNGHSFRPQLYLESDGISIQISSNSPVLECLSDGSVRLCQCGYGFLEFHLDETANYKAVEKYTAVTVKEPGLDKAQIISLQNVSKGIELKWENVPYAEGYYIYRSDENGLVDRIGECDAQTLSLLDEAVHDGSEYTYYVRAYSEEFFGECGCGYIVCIRPILKVFYAFNDDCIELYWEKHENVDGYYVFKKNKPGEWICLTKTIGSDANEFADPDVLPGQQCVYLIIAFKGEFMGSISNAGFTASYIETPKLLTIANSNGGITIKWEEVAGAAGYRIYRKEGENSEWQFAGNVSAGNNTFRDRSVAGGRRYSYTVTAMGLAGESCMKEQNLTCVYLKQPHLISAMREDGDLVIRWGGVTGARKYSVYRRANDSDRWKKISVVRKQKVLSYRDSAVGENENYYYTVRAVRGDSFSSYDHTGICAKAQEK